MFLDAGDFFKNYGLIIGLIILGIIIVVVVVLLIRNKTKSNNKKASNDLFNQIMEGLGGIANINSLEAKMSRLNVSLKDDNLLNVESLKSSGVSRVIKMSNKITLLIGNVASEIEEQFKKETKWVRAKPTFFNAYCW